MDRELKPGLAEMIYLLSFSFDRNTGPALEGCIQQFIFEIVLPIVAEPS
jgi:hypothetical protein